MRSIACRPGANPRWKALVATVCVLLILLAGAVHLLHVHSAEPQNDHAACGWCAVSHLAATPALSAPVSPELAQVGQTALLPDVLPACTLFARLHTIRPPPALPAA